MGRGGKALSGSERHAMKCPVIICAALALLCAPALAEETWLIEGQVVDEAGGPVVDLDVGMWWSSNGNMWDADGEVHGPKTDAEAAEFWSHEGVMVPRPESVVKQLGGGRFEIEVEGDWSVRSVLVMDRQHERGGLTVFKKDGERKATIVLRPLVRVTGRITCTEAGREPGFTSAVVHPPGDASMLPSNITRCGSFRGVFSLLLPPGQYDLELQGQEPDARMSKAGERDDAPAGTPPYLRGVRVTIPAGKAAVDLGTFDIPLTTTGRLQIASKRGDYRKCFGKEPPEIFFSDARGVGTDFRLASLRGKWVLLDFWGFSCGSCLARGLPELMEFYDQHAEQRQQFEIISFCVDTDGTVKTMEDVDRSMDPIAAKAWNGNKPGFPILVDHKMRTLNNFGLWHTPALLLVDPDGNLVDTGEEPPLDVLRSKLR
jgi:thiol-disulfide isomerase/thioredoxin